MGTKRRRRSRGRYETIPVGFEHFLAYGDFQAACEADRDTGWVKVFQFAVDHAYEQRRVVWVSVRDRQLADWVASRPGTRPWAWWEYDAPRWHRADLPVTLADMPDGALRELAEPRRQVSGPRPLHEMTDTWPQFSYGCALQFDRPIDVADPPQFEAQATYLSRHGLLSSEEQSRLPADAFEVETVVVDDDEVHEGDTTQSIFTTPSPRSGQS